MTSSAHPCRPVAAPIHNGTAIKSPLRPNSLTCSAHLSRIATTSLADGASSTTTDRQWSCATPTNAPGIIAPPTPPTTNTQPTAVAPNLPTTVRRLCARRTGVSVRDVAEIETVPLPMPGPGEVLLRVTHAGVNGGCETFRVRGEHLFAGNRNVDHYLLGAEGRGVVVAVGATSSSAPSPPLTLGQVVTFGGGGAFAEYALVPAARCFTPPQGVPGPQAVALALSGTVAYTALHAVAGVRAGEVVLVTAAAGGTGHMAVQAAQLAGAHVVATCGGAYKAARLKELGVARVIDYTQEDVGSVLQREYAQGIDLVYEGVGGAMFATAMANLHPQGRVLVLGYISHYPHNGAQQSPPPEVPGLPPVEELFWQQREVWRGEQRVYGQVVPRDPAVIARCRQQMFDWFVEGRLQAWVDESRTFDGLESVADAVEHMLSGGTVGKVVVRFGA